MIIHEYVTQPENRIDYLSLFRTALNTAEFNSFDAAVAYATMGGLSAIKSVFSDSHSEQWLQLTKRWLVGIDWCRTEPVAIDALIELDRSKVKIHDGQKVVLRRGCTPILPFHPKVFWLEGHDATAIISGFGNLSRNGLTRGHECGSLLIATNPVENHEQEIRKEMKKTRTWFDKLWKKATPANKVQDKYVKRFNDAEQFRSPTPTDDDIALTNRTDVGIPRTRALSPAQLRQLRAARHLWIEAGNLTENLGNGKPGNQLFMSPMTRVFFGFDAVDVPKKTPLGSVAVRYKTHLKQGCSLTFAHNSMDRLTLPVPGKDGPKKYDQETLLFEQCTDGTFRLTLGTAATKATWKRISKQKAASFKMRGGRQWGVS